MAKNTVIGSDGYKYSDDSSDFVVLSEAVPDVIPEIRYYSTYNFVGDRIAEHSGHSRGSTIDLTLFDMKTGKEADMGGTFDYFGQLSHPDYKDITEEQYANRMLLRDAMVKHGFKPIAEEWWHFTLDNEPFPDTYFTFPVKNA